MSLPRQAFNVVIRGEKVFKISSQNSGILVPHRGYFQNVRRVPPSLFIPEAPPTPGVTSLRSRNEYLNILNIWFAFQS